MATVIRSAQISDKAVTLTVRGHVAEPARAIEPKPAPAAVQPPPAIHQPVIASEKKPDQEKETETPASPQNEAYEPLLSSIHQREQQLQMRERILQKEMADERHRVLEAARAEGYKQGEAEAARFFQERLDALRKLATSFQEEFAGELADLEDAMVSIVFEAVCKIIGSSLHDRDGVVAVVREVTSRVREQKRLVLHVSPRDYKLLYENQDRLFGNGQRTVHELVPDDRVMLGGCLIETPGGPIDGRLEIQMQQLRDTLLSARKMLPE